MGIESMILWRNKKNIYTPDKREGLSGKHTSFLHENLCCGYSLETLCLSASNEYPQHIFSISPRKRMLWVLIRSASLFLHKNVCYWYSSEAPQ